MNDRISKLTCLHTATRFLRGGIVALIAMMTMTFISPATAQLFQRDTETETQSQENTTDSIDAKEAAEDIFGIPGDAVADAEANEEQEADPDGWEILQPSEANIRFRFPIKPRYVERSFSPLLGRPPIVVRMHIATESKDRSSVLSYHDLHDEPVTRDEIKAVLDGAVRGSVVRVLGRLDDAKNIKVGKFPGQEFAYSYTQDDKLHRAYSRVVLAGQRQYQMTILCAEGHDDPEFIEKALSSLEVFEAPTEEVPASTSTPAAESSANQESEEPVIRK